MKSRFFLYIALAYFIYAPAAFAQAGGGGMFRWSQTRMSLVYMTYGGNETEAPSTESVGFGAEIGTKKSGNYFGIIGKVRGTYTSGTESFMDGATQTDLTYTLIAAEPHLGLILNLIGGDPKGFRPYIGVSGFGGMLQLRFDSEDVTTLKPSENKFYTGFEAIAGVELYFRGAVNLYSLFGEVALRQARADIAGKTPYFLDALVITAGFSF